MPDLTGNRRSPALTFDLKKIDGSRGSSGNVSCMDRSDRPASDIRSPTAGTGIGPCGRRGKSHDAKSGIRQSLTKLDGWSEGLPPAWPAGPGFIEAFVFGLKASAYPTRCVSPSINSPHARCRELAKASVWDHDTQHPRRKRPRASRNADGHDRRIGLCAAVR